MGEHPEGLREPPLREGVGGIALVIDREGALEAFILQVGIEVRHLFGQHHALVDDRPARQARDIEPVDPGLGRGFLDAAADDIQLALEFFLLHALGVGDQDLLDLRPCGIGLLAQTADMHRHVAPAVDIVAHAQDLGLDDRAADFLSAEIRAGQEDLAHRNQLVPPRCMAGPTDLVIEEMRRDLHVDAGTVPGLAIGIDGTAVPDCLQRLDPVLDHLPRRLAVDVDDEAHTAGGVFFGLRVHAVLGHPRALGFLGPNPIGVVLGHWLSPWSGAKSAMVSASVNRV